MSSDTAAIEWTSRAGGEYKAIYSEDCSLCEFTFGSELCLQSPPCEDKHRSDGVPIAWVAKRNTLDVTIPEWDFQCHRMMTMRMMIQRAGRSIGNTKKPKGN